MLELIQKRFQTVVLAILVIVLSSVFIISFNGPQNTCSTSGSSFAARVHGSTITEGDFRAAYALVGFHRFPVDRARALRLRELTMDGLVERELLATEAERMGFTTDAHDVMRDAARTGIVWSTPPVDAPPGYPGPQVQQSFEDRDGQFSSKNMRRYIQNYLRRSIEEFERWQMRERLAQMARESVLATVTISPEEVHDEYVRDTDRAQIDYVRFTPNYYRDRIEANDAELRTWMEAHQEEVDQEFQRQRHRYTGLEEQRRARHILIKASADAPEAERTAARQRAEQLLRQARAGGDFEALARENSEDTVSARRGGDLGWNPRGRMVEAFDEAQFSTEPGTITDHVVETSFGFHVIRVDGRREGDVPEDDAKREVAEQLYQRARAGEMAREEAERAMAYLREGHTPQELDQRLAWGWQDPPAPGPDGTAPEPPERDTFAPQLRESRSFGRTEGAIAGATGSGEVTRAVFEMDEDDPLPDAPIQLGDDWYVYRLRERTRATEEGFTEETRQRIHDELLEEKRAEVLRAYVHGLRETAEEAGELRINEEMLQYGDEEPEEEDGEGEEGEDEEDEEEEEDDEPAEPEEESALPPGRWRDRAA